MSRTQRGSKPVGYEYWSKRPGNKCGNLLGAGKSTKKLTHSRERLRGDNLQYAEDELEAYGGIIDTVTDDEIEIAANPDVIIERSSAVESIYNVSFAGMSRQQIGDTIREIQRKVRREQGFES